MLSQHLPSLVDGGESLSQQSAAEEEFDLSDVLGEQLAPSAGDRAAAVEAELQACPAVTDPSDMPLSYKHDASLTNM